MSSVDLYIYLVIGLLGVAYPIMLQVISRLDEKYFSENIVKLFEAEYERKAFHYLLITSVTAIFIWSLKLSPYPPLDEYSFFNHSAVIIVGISTALLVVSFFFFVNKMLIYYTPTKFVGYLIKKHDDLEDGTEYFKALSDILLKSIRDQQADISATLSNFFSIAFQKKRQAQEPIEYPNAYYQIVYKAIEELSLLKEKRNYRLEHRTAGGAWLLGESREISPKTYSWLWNNLLLTIQYKQDDLVIYHWQTAHQYVTFSLSYIQPQLDYTQNNIPIINQNEIDKRIEERKIFVEFHYALGGLLLYSERYYCIGRLFNYTTSIPPKYELLPESMSTIFKFYFELNDLYDQKYSWISHQYPFPELEGLNADSLIKKWISSYMALLFLRQYTLYPYLIYMEPLAFPATPSTQGEIKKWINSLDFFYRLVDEHLNNGELMSKLKFEFITQQWCIDHQKIYPLDFINQFKKNLNEAYTLNARTLPIAEDKKIQFNQTTLEILTGIYTDLKKVTNETTEGEVDKWTINGMGVKGFQNRDAFIEHPEAAHLNFDSFLAESLSMQLIMDFSNSFIQKRTKTYLIKSEEVFDAIDKLNVTSGHVIVSFGIGLQSYIAGISGLSQDNYRGIPIHFFAGNGAFTRAIFILKKQDLPSINTLPPDKDEEKKYALESINKNLNIYTSIIDLNERGDILHEYPSDQIEKLRESILLYISMILEIKWKRNVSMVQIIPYSQFRQNGVPNSLDEVSPLDKKK